MEQYYKCLFEPLETVNWTENVYGTATFPVEDFDSHYRDVFLALNPVRPTRSDANVTAFRNFLVEFDSLELEAQLKTMKAAKIPWSACVFSGRRSYHFIISLDKPLATVEEWKLLRRRIGAALPLSDQNTMRPSNLTRAPEVVRPETGMLQELIEVRGRVSLEELEETLPVIKQAAPLFTWEERTKGKKRLNLHTKYYLLMGCYEPGKRNNKTYLAAYDMIWAGYSPEETVARLSKKTDLPFKEVEQCVKSALRAINQRSSSATKT
jgi:hypothetical protein